MTFSTLRIAWRNLGRNRRRTGLALAAIAVGQFGLLAYSGITHGVSDSVLDAVTGPLVGHVQIHAPEWRDERAMDLVLDGLEETLADIRACPGVDQATARAYAPVLAALEETGFQAVVIGVDPAVESGPRGLLAGLAEDELPGAGKALLGKYLAKKLKVKGGERIAVVGQGADGSIANDLFTVVSVVRCPVDLVNRLGIVMSLADAQELFVMPDQAHEIVVHVAEPGTSARVASALKGLGPVGGAEVLTWREAAPFLAEYIDLTDKAGVVMLVLVFIAAAAGVTNTMMMSTFERIHEFGMLLSLGSPPRRIVWMIVVEAVILGLVGVAIGSLAGSGFVAVLGRTGMDLTALGGDPSVGLSMSGMEFASRLYPRVELLDVLGGVVAVTFTSILAALWPAAHAARLQPVEALRA